MYFNPRYCLLALIFACNWATAQQYPAFTVSAYTKASSGYYFLCPIKKDPGPPRIAPCHLILDDKGTVVYFKPFATGEYTGDFRLNSNGLISYSYRSKYYLMDSTFKVIDSVFCKKGVKEDDHDMQILPNGHFLLLGSEQVHMDLSAFHLFRHTGTTGSTHAIVTSGVIQEQDAYKNVVFEWHAKDHFTFDEVDSAYLNSPDTVDWTHFNAVEPDADGNILVSSKHFNQITKLNRKDGSVIWKWGGNHNQFTFTNDPQQFKQQHDIRRIANGHITLFDNGSESTQFHPATAKEYVLNELEHTATLVWSYAEDKNSFSDGIGGTQRLANGNTLIAYGRIKNKVLAFNVVTPNAQKIFEVTFDGALVSYRAYNYPRLPWQLRRPKITCNCNNGLCFLEAEDGFKNYRWSNGQLTQKISVTVPGTYYVMASAGDGGYICSVPVTVNNLTNLCLPIR